MRHLYGSKFRALLECHCKCLNVKPAVCRGPGETRHLPDTIDTVYPFASRKCGSFRSLDHGWQCTGMTLYSMHSSCLTHSNRKSQPSQGTAKGLLQVIYKQSALRTDWEQP